MDGLKEKLIGIVGTKSVSDDTTVLGRYAKDRSLATPMMPRFIVHVKSADEVGKIVMVANETKTPLVPVSSGGPHYKGDTVPSVPESVIVDLSRMKKIMNINRQQRVAIVEPGVTYGELQKALAKEGMMLSTSLAPRATKSVLASVLDIEPRLNSLHQWNFIDPLRCAEVTWGDGNRMYTGEAGGSPMDLQKQWSTERWQVSGTGPMMLDFYRLLTGSQGSMGIVTWVSLKCEVNPTVHKLYFVPAKKSEELNDFVYRVIRLRFSNELMIMNSSYLAALLGGSADQVNELMRQLPLWVALIGIAGGEILPEERVKGQEQDIAEIAQQFGLNMVPAVIGAKGDKVLEKILNTSGERSWKETYNSHSASLRVAFQNIWL